jgi:hypothetical protein
VDTCHAMGGHGWAYVATDGYGLGMVQIQRRMLGSGVKWP